MTFMQPGQFERFQELHNNYQPNDKVIASIGEITCVTVSGARCSGKNTILSRSGFEIVRGVTTRPVRTGETGGEYVFRPDTPSEYDKIIAELEAGQWLQFELGISGYVYGSYPEQYRGPVAITDNTPKGVEALRDKGFKAVRHGYVAVPYVMWHKRFFRERALQLTPEQCDATISEAKESAEAALEDDSFIFVPNADGEIDEAVHDFHLLGIYGDIDEERSVEGRKICEQFLRLLDWDYGD